MSTQEHCDPPVEAQVELARRAFVFGYATVDLYRILHDFALDPASPEYKGPLNTSGARPTARGPVGHGDRGDERRHALLLRVA